MLDAMFYLIMIVLCFGIYSWSHRDDGSAYFWLWAAVWLIAMRGEL